MDHLVGYNCISTKSRQFNDTGQKIQTEVVGWLHSSQGTGAKLDLGLRLS
ncbi:hypothetical protein RchiOBHm_Chr6g0282971 [Rosa chinensis]|uniref:Uncharacterized protein n=1 Tax=Rosa chinensis TaxID=74649 RepID=A0A2P6PTW5_ROSCH|nr:hypothetical protein RchiOBHm_Chr6g0282971 [Rosa chinensis]